MNRLQQETTLTVFYKSGRKEHLSYATYSEMKTVKKKLQQVSSIVRIEEGRK